MIGDAFILMGELLNMIFLWYYNLPVICQILLICVMVYLTMKIIAMLRVAGIYVEDEC